MCYTTTIWTSPSNSPTNPRAMNATAPNHVNELGGPAVADNIRVRPSGDTAVRFEGYVKHGAGKRRVEIRVEKPALIRLAWFLEHCTPLSHAVWHYEQEAFYGDARFPCETCDTAGAPNTRP